VKVEKSIIKNVMKIRKGKIADTNQCFKLTKTPEFIFPGQDDFTKKYLKDFIEKGEFLVAEDKNEILGFISSNYIGKRILD
jgi:hypothetical protein